MWAERKFPEVRRGNLPVRKRSLLRSRLTDGRRDSLTARGNCPDDDTHDLSTARTYPDSRQGGATVKERAF
jgi:hypothetical protein